MSGIAILSDIHLYMHDKTYSPASIAGDLMFSFVRIGFVLSAAAVLTACTGTPTPNPTAVAFETKVELKYASPACDEDPRCWLPTQFAPKLASGESVSLFEQWPLKGDSVGVICETTGESIQDYTGKTTDKWYGILVPTDKLVTNPPEAQKNAEAQVANGGVIGYVSALWLAETNATAPSC